MPRSASTTSSGSESMTSSAVAPEHRIWPPARQRSQAGGAVDRATEVVAVAEFDLAGVQRHSDAHGLAQRPRLMGDRVLQLDGRCGRRRRPIEYRERGVSFAARLDQPPAARRDDLFDDLVVARERHRHRVGVGLPGRGRPLDVGEQEGHRACDGRDMLRHGISSASSWATMAASSLRSSGPGSTPNWSASSDRAR